MSTNPPAEEARKGLSGTAIAGIGCLALLIVVGITGMMVVRKISQKVQDIAEGAGDNPGLVMARLALAANPDLEIVSTDETSGEITLREKKTGNTITMPISDLSKGKITWQEAGGKKTTVDMSQSEAGKMTIDGPEGRTVLSSGLEAGSLPAWIPAYPKALPREGGMSTESPDGVAGTLFFTSKDGVQKAAKFYENQLKAQGFDASASVVQEGGFATATITALKGENTTVNIVIQPEDTVSVITISFHGPKP